MALISVSNNALSNITALPASIPTGALTLIKSITASASASIEFINGTDGVVLDGTYSSYIFKGINIHPSTDDTRLTMFFSTNSGSTYGVTKTTTHFIAWHDEADTNTNLGYRSGDDLAQSTDGVVFDIGGGSDNDQSSAYTIQLFNPSSSTYVKHFISTNNFCAQNDFTMNTFVSGYVNTTSPINAIKFQMSSGNIDDGIIKLYGVS